MKTSETVQSIMPAFVKAQKAMPAIEKNKKAIVRTTKGQYEFMYADIADVLKMIRDPLHANGLCVFQDASSTDSGLHVTTRLVHESGEWVESDPIYVPANPLNPQAVGSGLTYGRRYSLSTLLGIATSDDDDGATAGRDQNQRQPAQRTTPPSGQQDGSPKSKGAGAVQDYAGVQSEDLGDAIRACARAAGIELGEGKKFTDDEWNRLYQWVEDQNKAGVSFEDATAKQKEAA